MSDVRGSIGRGVQRAAMFASIFVAGGIVGWVASERDLLPAPPRGTVATASADTAAMPPAIAPADAGMPAPMPAEGALGPLGEVAVAPPAPGDTAAAGPHPTTGELAALRATLVVPVRGVARSELRDTFHERRDAGARPHHALDILAPRGTPVLSAAAGRLLKLFTSDAGGLMVYAADPSERFVLVYSHLDGYAEGLTEGMTLRQGQPLGTVGTTGNAPADTPHLHFAIARNANVSEWWRGTPVDPRALLAP